MILFHLFKVQGIVCLLGLQFGPDLNNCSRVTHKISHCQEKNKIVFCMKKHVRVLCAKRKPRESHALYGQLGSRPNSRYGQLVMLCVRSILKD